VWCVSVCGMCVCGVCVCVCVCVCVHLQRLECGSQKTTCVSRTSWFFPSTGLVTSAFRH